MLHAADYINVRRRGEQLISVGKQILVLVPNKGVGCDGVLERGQVLVVKEQAGVAGAQRGEWRGCRRGSGKKKHEGCAEEGGLEREAGFDISENSGQAREKGRHEDSFHIVRLRDCNCLSGSAAMLHGGTRTVPEAGRRVYISM